MILKNKLTKETLDIPYSEFRKKLILWSLIFTLNYIGISIILEIVTGILNALINIYKWTKSFFESESFFFKPKKIFFPIFIII